MTTPDQPLRMELTFELPASPEQVWRAIATGAGISSWFLPTDLDEREGGTIVTHMGEDASSEGVVTGWDPPHRFAYEEPEWAGLTGHAGAEVTPLVTEFLVEARSGGTCVVRVVSSAFGTGADWEEPFFEDMERMWLPFFERLRLFLTHFPGQTATPIELSAAFPGVPGPLAAAMRASLGVSRAGERLTFHGVRGEVETVGDAQLLARLTDPVPGLIAFIAYPTGHDVAAAAIQAHLFSADAPALIEQERPAWEAWLKSLTVPAA